MRKKFVTTLLIGILSVVCALGFTACGDNGEVKVPKGQEVTEEEWKAAIEATVKADNYTCELSQTSTQTINDKDDSGKDITLIHNTNISGTEYLGNTSLYAKSSHKYSTTGMKDFYEDEEDEEIENKTETYCVIEGKVIWQCQYYEYIDKNDTSEEQEKSEWSASQKELPDNVTTIGDYFNNSITDMLSGEYATSKDSDETKPLKDLYSTFTYKDGKYSAVVYAAYEGDATLSISIKDGYVVGLEYSTQTEHSEGNRTQKEETTATVVLKNFGKTTVNAPAGATEAINKAKAE